MNSAYKILLEIKNNVMKNKHRDYIDDLLSYKSYFLIL